MVNSGGQMTKKVIPCNTLPCPGVVWVFLNTLLKLHCIWTLPSICNDASLIDWQQYHHIKSIVPHRVVQTWSMTGNVLCNTQLFFFKFYFNYYYSYKYKYNTDYLHYLETLLLEYLHYLLYNGILTRHTCTCTYKKKILKKYSSLFSEWKMMNDGHLILKRARFEIHN